MDDETRILSELRPITDLIREHPSRTREILEVAGRARSEGVLRDFLNGLATEAAKSTDPARMRQALARLSEAQPSPDQGRRNALIRVAARALASAFPD